MGSTRSQVLQHMLNQQRSTINDLAKAVKINPISVRHHIGKLEAEGLVESAEERHGVGRPRRVYYLTQAGMERFPARTIRFTKQLLAELKGQLAPEAYNKLFTKMASSIAEGYVSDKDLHALSLKERMALVKHWLVSEGFTVQVSKTDKEIVIKETSCPYYHVGQEHGEVCAIDRALIAKALSAEPKQTTCLLSGDSHCTYIVPLAAIKEAIPN